MQVSKGVKITLPGRGGETPRLSGDKKKRNEELRKKKEGEGEMRENSRRQV